MSCAGWYVIQVQSGKEQAMCQLIERVCAEVDATSESAKPLLNECFTPQFITRHKFGDEWRDVTKLLLPGYLVAVTERPEALTERLRSIPKFARMLSVGEQFVPLNEAERAWMYEFTSQGERVVPMSMAVKSGDSIVVTSGPLKGKEALITKVNRRKCLAFVELYVGGMKVTTTVGLGIVDDDKEPS